MSEGTNTSGYAGRKKPSASASPFNMQTFLIQQLLGRVRTVQLAKVMKVTVESGVSPVGFVDVLPIVNMLDGAGQATKHGTIFGLPYFRLQGGKSAIICDPVVGDIGIIAIADRDISTVKKTKAQGNPGSFRQFDLADGIYLGGVLNGAPTQYVRFVVDGDGEPIGIDIVDALDNSIKTSDAGIVLEDKNGNKIEMVEAGIKINDVLFDRDQNVSNVEEVTSKTDTTLTQHTHAQGPDSDGDTEEETDPPTEGT